MHYNVEEMKKNFALPPLQHAAPSLSRVSPKISPKVQSLDLPPPSHLPPVPVSTSTPAKPKKKKKHRRDKKHNNDDSHIDQSNGSVPKPDVISGTSAIELEDYGEGNLYTPRELPSLSYAPASTSFIIDRALSLDQGEDVPTPPQPRFYKRQF